MMALRRDGRGAGKQMDLDANADDASIDPDARAEVVDAISHVGAEFRLHEFLHRNPEAEAE